MSTLTWGGDLNWVQRADAVRRFYGTVGPVPAYYGGDIREWLENRWFCVTKKGHIDGRTRPMILLPETVARYRVVREMRKETA